MKLGILWIMLILLLITACSHTSASLKEIRKKDKIVISFDHKEHIFDFNESRSHSEIPIPVVDAWENSFKKAFQESFPNSEIVTNEKLGGNFIISIETCIQNSTVFEIIRIYVIPDYSETKDDYIDKLTFSNLICAETIYSLQQRPVLLKIQIGKSDWRDIVKEYREKWKPEEAADEVYEKVSECLISCRKS